MLILYSPTATAQQNIGTDSLIKVLQSAPEDSSKVNNLRLLYNKYRNNDHNKAFQIAKDELSLSQKIKYPKGIASAYRHLGIEYYFSGSYTKAIENYLLALRIYKKINNKFFIAACYNNIGNVYSDQNNLKEAIKYTKKAIEIWRPLSDCKDGIATGLNNLGEIYSQMGNDSLALSTFKECIAISHSIDYKYIEAMALMNIGSIYLKQNDFNTARVYLEKSYLIAIEVNDKTILTENLYLTSKIYFNEKKYGFAMKILEQVIKLAQDEGLKESLANAYNQMAEINSRIGQYRKAFEYQKLEIDIRKNLDKVRSERDIEKFQFQYELEKKELQNQVLVEEKKFYESEKEIDNIRKKVGINILLFLAVLAAFYFRNFKQQKRKNELLTLQKEEISCRNKEIIAQHALLSKQSDELAKANYAMNKLFGIISHDLRAPLSSIAGFLSVMEELYLQPDLLKTFSIQLHDSVIGTLELLDNLLKWSSTQMSGITVNPQSFNIYDLINNSISVFSPIANSKKINIEIATKGSFFAWADKDMIYTVIRNLISNAIKFSNPNDTVTVFVNKNKNEIEIAVKDTGNGMSKTVQDMIFDRTTFYSSVGTQKEKGTGLGLKFCLDAVTMNKGTIWVESEEGKGSTFHFTVPGI